MTKHDCDKLYPADIAPMAQALDELAEVDRAAARSGLEARVARAAWPRRAAGFDLASRSEAGAGAGSGWRGWVMRPSMRLAASVAVMAGGVAAWVAMQPGAWVARPGGGAGGPVGDAAPSLEQDVDAWLSLAGPDDGLGARIEALHLMNDDLVRGLEPGWLEDELSGESL